jgi:glycosyltransferase involved in cell wall biosynthesis
MRILIATDYYPPFVGGAQIQSRLLARNLRARGHDVCVVTVTQPGLPVTETDGDIPVYRLRHLRTVFESRRQGTQSHHPPFVDPVTSLALRRLIRDFDPDVVHSFGWISYSCAAALTGRRTPLVVAARDYGYFCANRTLLRDGRACSGPSTAKCLACAGRNYGRPKGWIAAATVLASRPYLRHRIAALHCISTYVFDTLRRDFLGRSPRMPTYVIHDAVDAAEPDVSEEARARLRQLPNEPFILFVGAMREAKGVAELLAAYERLRNPPPLVLLGTIEPDAPKFFPPGVHVVPAVPHTTVLAAWDRSLFGVMPSLLPEPLGTVVAEAMTRGKAVIGTAPGGHTDMILPGETGLLVPRGDVEALAWAMQQLLDDPDLRERLGREAAARSRRFASSVSITEVERMLAEAIERSR